MSKTTLTFRIIEPTGSDTPRVEAFTQAVVKIGRIASQHVRLEDDDVSGMHAVVEATDAGEVTIIDLGSKSGTFVNGQQINKTTLQSGDQIRVGQTVLTVEIAAAKAAVSVAPAPEVARAPAGGSLPAPNLPGFAVPGAAAHGSEEDGSRYRYGIAANGPALRTDDVETGDRAVEVVVMWGLGDEANVLHVAHLNPPRTYYIGDETNEKGKLTTDFLVAGDALGTSRYPVVIDTGSGAAIVVPKGAKGIIQTTEGVQTMEQLRAAGKLVPCTELAGAEQLPIPSGATARIEHRGMTFIVRPVSAAKRIGGTTFTAATILSSLIALCVIGSMSLHGVFLLAMYFMPPGSSSLSLDELMADRRLARYLSEPPETVEEETPEDFLQEKKDDEGGKGKRHKLEEGAMGKESSKKTNNKFGIKGPQDNEDPHMAREAAMEQAKTAGILGTLRQVMGAWNSPTSPFGRETALGADSMSALGALMGDQIGENFGYGGLGLRGTGRGGGGTGEGTIGLGNVGTIGHGAGGGSGSGYGGGAGGFGGRQTKVPKIRQGNADVRGSLSKEVIRRVIQRHINEVRFCYEQELNQRPDLAGRVTVSFVISATGAVQTAAVASSDLGAPRVDQCVATAVRRWTFPAPEGGGVVLVNYPFAFEQAGGQ